METRTQIGVVVVALALASGVAVTDLGTDPSDDGNATRVAAELDGGGAALAHTSATPSDPPTDTAVPTDTPTPSPTDAGSTATTAPSPTGTATTDATGNGDGVRDRSDPGRRARETPSTDLTLTHNVSVG